MRLLEGLGYNKKRQVVTNYLTGANPVDAHFPSYLIKALDLEEWEFRRIAIITTLGQSIPDYVDVFDEQVSTADSEDPEKSPEGRAICRAMRWRRENERPEQDSPDSP